MAFLWLLVGWFCGYDLRYRVGMVGSVMDVRDQGQMMTKMEFQTRQTNLWHAMERV